LSLDSNTSGSLDKPLNHGSFKKQNVNSLIAKLEFDVLQSKMRSVRDTLRLQASRFTGLELKEFALKPISLEGKLFNA
jgi:hypothetical protein